MRRKWGPGEVQMYEEMGTTTDVKKCNFCGTRGLAETVVLLVYNVDGEPTGNMYACDPCAAEAARRDAQKPQRSHRSQPDPRLDHRRR